MVADGAVPTGTGTAPAAPEERARYLLHMSACSSVCIRSLCASGVPWASGVRVRPEPAQAFRWGTLVRWHVRPSLLLSLSLILILSRSLSL